ncbi:kinase [Geomonas limicola]|uniref:Kinase n=1 Tax=Geomonas limicola TaxID=2740186 RepID=A0A6V8N662_9BACT|nr:bifunctional aminoglycoside phosphotransferase/ATP-binding protein [Geomonas limicola]GFO66779.1 kinase [Geomonas limicola]
MYKVKKPVDFGFLNFTTLDRRRFYCEEEVRLNRRLCPDIYLGVVELRQGQEGLRFEGTGTLVDYAVKMKRLPEERMLQRIVERGELALEQLDELARVIAAFHLEAARGPHIDELGSVAAIRANWTENFQQIAPYLGRTISRGDLAFIEQWIAEFLDTRQGLLQQRVAEGYIRECDGDLHLGNICLTDRVCIFDCIEFNERFRYSDTAADVAFLLMDLDNLGHPEFCEPFLQRYQETTGDHGLTEVLDFYRIYRAFVRGKVTSLRLSEELSEEEAGKLAAAANRYFRLARGYCLRERLAPMLIVTCGVMGSGKSALAGELCRDLGLTLLSSDRVRKALAGRAPTERGKEGYGAGIYSPESSEATYRALLERAREELVRGHGVVVDATFRRRGDRAAFQALAESLGVPYHLVEIRCEREVLARRLRERSLDPSVVSDGRVEFLERQLAEFEAPGPGEALVVDSGLPLDQEVDQVLEGLGVLP